MSRHREIRKDEDLKFSATLRQRLADEATFDDGKPGAIWFALRRNDGRMVEVKGNALLIAPHPMQVSWAMDMANWLNKDLHHDGFWIVAFTNPPANAYLFQGVVLEPQPLYERWVIIWVDREGDPQFTIENDDEFIETMMVSPDDQVELCEGAWREWHEKMRAGFGKALDKITYAAAQGEAAPSSRSGLIH